VFLLVHCNNKEATIHFFYQQQYKEYDTPFSGNWKNLLCESWKVSRTTHTFILLHNSTTELKADCKELALA